MPGLSSAAAQARLEREGANALPEPERRSALRVLWDVVREPMFLLLLVAAGIYVVLGDVHEALTLLGFVVVVIVITVVQENRSEKALDALRDLSSPQATVLRDGVWLTVAARELVRGDVVRLGEGDRVPADALLRDGNSISVDESLLTGESVPVHKLADAAVSQLARPGGEGGASLYAGTLIVSGHGWAEIVATGPHSELGRIGDSLREVSSTRTPLQRDVDRTVRIVATAAVALSISVLLIRGFSGTGWLEAALGGITLAMALLPEELPVILSVFLALGAWRIARSRVLTRRLPAVETLGAVTVLCTDKTGTLTQNRMTVRRLVTLTADVPVGPDVGALPEAVHDVVEYGILACPRDPVDPMERAILDIGRVERLEKEHLHPRWRAIREYPLQPGLLAVTHVWRASETQRSVVATKGAPEAILDLCHLKGPEAQAWRDRADALAREGLRVLGVARAQFEGPLIPEIAHDYAFDFVGLIGLADPLRPEVAQAVRECHEAGIRVVMITGDHPDTACAIARDAGIPSEPVLTGPDLELLSEEALVERLQNTHVVARAVPAQKLRLVRALRTRGEVVGMTGDGVNDAPALKAADIGIAMGRRGTEVARAAAALVLLDDDFNAIVVAARTGRRIYDNLRKAFGYTMSVHVPIAGLSLIPALLGWPSLLGPVNVALLQLVIDPTCSVVFEMEPEEHGVMQRPPRPIDAHLFNRRQSVWSLVQGGVVLLAALFSVALMRAAGIGIAEQRTIGFTALLAGNLSLILANRSDTMPVWTTFLRPNPALRWLGLAVLLIAGLFVGFPAVRHTLDMGDPSWRQFLTAAALGSLPVFALDVVKLFRRKPIEPRRLARATP